MRAIRWAGEADRYFGPFTYARERKGWRPIAVVLGSGDDDDYPGCRLRMSAFGHTLIVALPAIIKPWRRWVDITTEPTRTQMLRAGRKPGYWDAHEREYGFTCSDGHLSVKLGRQTHDSSTTQSWGWFVPWRAWRHVRRSFYGLAGEWIADEPQRPVGKLDMDQRRALWADQETVAQLAPTVTFAFDDFDGERINVVSRIEEREWRLGEGAWRWLSWFRRPKVERSLDLRFSSETGHRKGSWKGGTMGHSIGMLPGELHEDAFRRYCARHDMKFVSIVANG